MNKLPVSVLIAAWNEEKNLEDCLESVAWADDVLVIDGGSQDRTREIAKTHGARVLATENDFAEAQRLKGLKEARHPWFLLLDADERVSKPLAQSIAETIASPDTLSAYFVLRRNLYKGKPVRLHHPDYQMRLFQRDRVTLPQKIHRVPDVQGKIGRLSGALDHHFFTTVDDYLKKLKAYSGAEASYHAGARPSGFKLAYWLALRPILRFIQYYFLKRGFLDGYFGLFYSVSSAYYEWAVASRLVIDPAKKSS